MANPQPKTKAPKTPSTAHRKPVVLERPDMDTPAVGMRAYIEALFKAIHERIDVLVEQIKACNKRIDAIREYFDERVDALKEYYDKRFDDFKVYVGKRFDAVDRRFDDFKEYVGKRFDAIDKRFDASDRRFDRLIMVLLTVWLFSMGIMGAGYIHLHGLFMQVIEQNAQIIAALNNIGG